MPRAHAPPGVLLICQNAQGLTGPKLQATLFWLREQRADIAVITETQAPGDIEDLLRRMPGAGAVWPGAQFFFCPGTGHTAGVCIILGPSCSASRPTLHVGPAGHGRVLRLDLTLLGKSVCLVGAYGPAQPGDRQHFFSTTLRSHLPGDGRPLLLTGDLNCVLSELDCVYPPGHPGPAHNTRLAGAPALTELMADHGLVDVWRAANGASRAHTHWSAPANSGGRLDRWLASESFLQAFSASSTILPAPGIRSDHLPVSLRISSDGDPFPRGRGLQGFPLQLLNMPAAQQELAALVLVEAVALQAGPDDGIVQRWDRMKEVLRAHSWEIFRWHRRVRQQGARAAEAAASRARQRMLRATPADDFGALCLAAQAAADAATLAWRSLSSPAIEAAATLDHMFGDTSSYYFHHLARAPHPPTVIRHLNRPGRLPASPPEPADLASQVGVQLGLDYCRMFYSSDSPSGLFHARTDIQGPAQEALLASLPRRLSASSAALAEGLDGDGLLAPEELDLALQLSNRGSVPGIDGLPYEFYRAFKDSLVPVLCRVFNAAFRDTDAATPLRELLVGVLCLLPKPGQPVDELSGYRPITLLNCDVKLLMLVLSNRLQRPLDYVIDITQSAFLRGRDISDNVRYHLGLTTRLQELGLPGWLLHSDLTKAYDTADRGWLLRSMQAMGFREAGVVRWCSVLMAGTSARVRLNGFLTTVLPVPAGLPQGGSLSCQEWVILLEPCLSYLSQLRASGHIAGFPLPDGSPAPAACAFADDTKSFVQDPEQDGPVIRAAFATAAQAGLPLQSVPKTKLLYLRGPVPPALDPTVHPSHAATGYRLQSHTDPHRLLGVPFCPDEARCQAAAFDRQAIAMRHAAGPWAPLRLSLLGRSHVALQCLASKCVYQANFREPSPTILPAIQKALNTFVGTSGRAEEASPFPGQLHPKFAISVLPPAAGGIGIPHVAAHVKAMQAKTAWLLFRYSSHPWLQLFRHEVASASVAEVGRPPGLHTLVTHPAQLQLPATCTPLVRSAVGAFRQLGVTRVLTPADQGFESVLRELTFYNSPGPEWQPVRPLDMSAASSKQWVRLADVRSAHLQRAQLSAAEAADLDCILGLLPPPWRAAVTDPAPVHSPWSSVPPLPDIGLPVFHGPDPVSGELRLWELWPGGRLHCLPPGTAQAPGPVRPATVTLRPKDRTAWSRADHAYASAQQLLPTSDRRPLLEPWLVGIWPELPLDPAVWGIRPPSGLPVSLLDMTVRDARRQLSHRLHSSHQGSAAGFVRGYQEAQAAWPKAWRIAPPGAPAPPPDLRGLEGLEERWRQSASVDPDLPGPPDAVDRVPHWLDLQRASVPRPSREERAAERELADVGPVPLRPGFNAVWKRLDDPTLHRPFRITCWKVLHGCLGCKAFLHHVHRRADDRPNAPPAPQEVLACDAPGCFAAGTLETITHAFLDCPEVAPVIDWLLATWAQLSGSAVPRCPRVLLADDLDAWPGHPADPATLRLWTRLRVAVLGAVWRVRCARDEGPGVSFARRVVSLALQHLLGAIRRDWSRTQGDVRLADAGAFCVDWWRGFDVELAVNDFVAQWARPAIFCRVVGAPPLAAGAADHRQLELLVGPGLPVPLPP